MFERIQGAMTSADFIPHGHCFLWIPSLLWLHVGSDLLIGLAYLGISILLYVLVRTIRLPFSPVFIAFGLFIGLCGLTHFMSVWTVWNPDYWASGYLKAATAVASVATAIGLVYVRPQIEEVVYAARLSEERRNRLETANGELEALYGKVKELDQLKSQFFANVSHELRTPLALILGPTDQLLQADNLTPQQHRQLKSVNQNAKALIKQVNDLLDISRFEAGGMQIHYAEVDLAALFRMIASQFEIAAEQREIDYRVSAPESLVAQVDADMLERVLVNLLSNAFKFTPSGGTITAALTNHDGEIECSVTDTGSGVQPEQREVIFERFRQAEGGATRIHGGTGIGLAIVKDVVELHKGQVAVSETPGGGATFTVTLPRQAPADNPVEEVPHQRAASSQASLEGALHELNMESPISESVSAPLIPGRPQVLVVEDNQEMREFVAGILMSDYNVVTARDGQEGLEQAEALRPDLIVTDIMMPRLSGDRLVYALRERTELEPVPILLLSAKADEQLRIKLLSEGAQDYLNKPFLPAELKARAANLVSVKRASDTLREQLTSLSTDLEVLAKEIAIKNRYLQTARDAAEVAREQAERATEVKSYFLGMVSHEFRTPLSTVQMNLQLMLRDRSGTLPPESRPRLERLASASRQMHSLIEGLLEYTRLESGRISAQVQPVDLAALAVETVEEHRFALPESFTDALSLRFEQPTTPQYPQLESDPKLIKVILSNLVSNAVKFTEQGTITVSIECTDLEAIITVRDTGLGIPEDAMDRIFLPFEQLEPVQRKTIPGIGLGLALVKQLAEMLGGRIKVSSVPGAGSTFTVTLPTQQRLNPVVDQPARSV